MTVSVRVHGEDDEKCQFACRKCTSRITTSGSGKAELKHRRVLSRTTSYRGNLGVVTITIDRQCIRAKALLVHCSAERCHYDLAPVKNIRPPLTCYTCQRIILIFLKISYDVLVLLNNSYELFGAPLKSALGAQIPLAPLHGTALQLGNIRSVVSAVLHGCFSSSSSSPLAGKYS